MPELPEVECLTRALRQTLKGGRLTKARFLTSKLREPIPSERFRRLLEGELVEDVLRRSKYMLMKTSRGFGIFHLGMTGNMLCLENDKPVFPHTHAIFTIDDAQQKRSYLHFIDPRRFGRIDCQAGDSFEKHVFFANLGPEPLKERKLGEHLYDRSRGRKQATKVFLMDARHVVGVGNIYASEALFRAGVHPGRPAGSLSSEAYKNLAQHIKETLRDAIKAGGTSFRDFKNSNGNPGYFSVSLAVYDRASEPCRICQNPIEQIVQGGRSTFFCAICQL